MNQNIKQAKKKKRKPWRPSFAEADMTSRIRKHSSCSAFAHGTTTRATTPPSPQQHERDEREQEGKTRTVETCSILERVLTITIKAPNSDSQHEDAKTMPSPGHLPCFFPLSFSSFLLLLFCVYSLRIPRFHHQI